MSLVVEAITHFASLVYPATDTWMLAMWWMGRVEKSTAATATNTSESLYQNMDLL